MSFEKIWQYHFYAIFETQLLEIMTQLPLLLTCIILLHMLYKLGKLKNHFHLLQTRIDFIIQQTTKIMSTQAQIVADLQTATTQIAQFGTELTTLNQTVTNLETALAGQPSVTPELQAAVDALKAQVATVAAIVPTPDPTQTESTGSDTTGSSNDNSGQPSSDQSSTEEAATPAPADQPSENQPAS